MTDPATDDAELTARLDAVLRDGVSASAIPGGVALIAVEGAVRAVAAHGAAALRDDDGPLDRPIAMTRDTAFDVASVTKVVATTAACMTLAEAGDVDPHDTVRRWLPEFDGDGRGAVTVADLLEHRSGLPDWAPLFLHTTDRADAVRRICTLDLVDRPGATRTYSDLGMILAGAIIEAATGQRLDVAVAELVRAPLGLSGTGYGPIDAGAAAATSTGNPPERRMVAARRERGEELPDAGPGGWRTGVLRGEVNDANAAQALHGVSGHAGAFATVDELAVLMAAIAGHGEAGAVAAWGQATRARFLGPGRASDQGLGVWRERLSPLGRAGAADDSVGHRGFTGCEVAASPRDGWIAVLCTNRLHSGEDPPTDHKPLWREILHVATSGAGALGH